MVGVGTFVLGVAGVFFADRMAAGRVFKTLVAGNGERLVGVVLNSGEVAWVPESTVQEVGD